MRASCVEAPARRGQELKEVLDDLDLREGDLRIKTVGGSILIPVEGSISDAEMEEVRGEVPSAELLEGDFEERETGPRSLKEALEGRLPRHLLPLAPSSFDVIGDIAVVELPDELEDYGREVGDALLDTHPSLETALAKGSSVEGEFRTRRHRHLAGAKERETVHREHACEFGVDVEGAYFSPRLSAERERVFRRVEPGEVVLDMFAGVGPFAVEVAKYGDPERVVAVDKNPRAYGLLVRNVERNAVTGTVRPVHGDASDVARELEGRVDRVIMNLPRSAEEFLDEAVAALKPEGGVVHYYEVTDDPDVAEERLRLAVEEAGRVVYSVERREVRSFSPAERHWAFDARVRPERNT